MSPATTALIAALIVAALALTACGSNADAIQATNQSADETTRLWIKPELVDCEGVAPQQCMEIATAEDGPYEFFYDSIDGYTHTEGKAAVIDVTIEDVHDAPADASSLRYTLARVIE